jgi:hypothetical protein
MDTTVNHLNNLHKNGQENLKQKFFQVESEIRTLHDHQQKQVSFIDRIGESEDSMMNMIKSEMKKIVTIVSEEMADQRAITLENKYIVDRNNRMYDRMKNDICRHE